MDITKAQDACEAELKLDLSGLLGAGQVFAAGEGAQAELIDANCNQIGIEGGCCTT